MWVSKKQIQAHREVLREKVAELGIEREHAQAIYDAAPDMDTDQVGWLKYYRANKSAMETADLHLQIGRLTKMLSEIAQLMK